MAMRCEKIKLFCIVFAWPCSFKQAVKQCAVFKARESLNEDDARPVRVTGAMLSQATILPLLEIATIPSSTKRACIWSNFMRMHIGIKICHFLQSVVCITEGPKKQNYEEIWHP